LLPDKRALFEKHFRKVIRGNCERLHGTLEPTGALS
jgi:hypothetical protein